MATTGRELMRKAGKLPRTKVQRPRDVGITSFDQEESLFELLTKVEEAQTAVWTAEQILRQRRANLAAYCTDSAQQYLSVNTTKIRRDLRAVGRGV